MYIQRKALLHSALHEQQGYNACTAANLYERAARADSAEQPEQERIAAHAKNIIGLNEVERLKPEAIFSQGEGLMQWLRARHPRCTGRDP